MSESGDLQPTRTDLGFVAVLLLVVIVVVWLVSMPICQFVQRATLERMHLQTRPFVAWVIQQPIPAMYNFYNRFEIRPSPWGKEGDDSTEKGTVNHFPVRMFTFGDNRAVFLSEPKPRQLDVWSSYRGEELHTRWVATPSAQGGFDLTNEVVEAVK